MIFGSGLLAKAFSADWQSSRDVCIYAAGVSNSSSRDVSEFIRDRQRLEAALNAQRGVDAFVYFGTCSVGDHELQCTPYVQHKIAMEQLVLKHSKPLIIRLPQLAGHTSNPHTLLNFLHAHIASGEEFVLWKKAYRNIIDVADVVTLANFLIKIPAARGRFFNLANIRCFSMLQIVSAMEFVLGKKGVYHSVERGSRYEIDVEDMQMVLQEARINFDEDYLLRVLKKYYEPA